MIRKRDDYWKNRAIELERELEKERHLRMGLEMNGIKDAPDYACGLCEHHKIYEEEPGVFRVLCLAKSNCPDFLPRAERKPNE